jgi:hypothetical protein
MLEDLSMCGWIVAVVVAVGKAYTKSINRTQRHAIGGNHVRVHGRRVEIRFVRRRLNMPCPFNVVIGGIGQKF